jgi:hypothetical protein
VGGKPLALHVAGACVCVCVRVYVCHCPLFTCFAGTKVQILTPEERQFSRWRTYALAARVTANVAAVASVPACKAYIQVLSLFAYCFASTTIHNLTPEELRARD